MAAQVALRRQQTTDSDANPSGVLNRIHKLETLLNQKRIYQKHLRSLQQSSLAKDVLSGKFRRKFTISWLDRSQLLTTSQESLSVCGRRWTTKCNHLLGATNGHPSTQSVIRAKA